MAVAVKNSTDNQTRSGAGSLAMSSILGAGYILLAAAIVAQGVPYVWRLGIAQFLPASMLFVSVAGLILVLLVALGLLVAVGSALVGPSPPKGLRAGIFTVFLWVAAAILLSIGIGRLFETWLAQLAIVGIVAMVAVLFGLLFFGWTLLNRPKTQAFLQTFEEQGWFSSLRYKASQGLRVRRATMLGIMLLGGAGIYALFNHSLLITSSKDWVLRIPFSTRIVTNADGVEVFTERFIPVLPDIRFTIPLLLAGASFWLAFRVVNLPVFADFLIATEAEINKVSWPTRKSVAQDTVVVLITVFMLTIFLLVVDLTWGYVLSREVVGVLKKPPEKTPEEKQAEQQRLEGQIPW